MNENAMSPRRFDTEGDDGSGLRVFRGRVRDGRFDHDVRAVRARPPPARAGEAATRGGRSAGETRRPHHLPGAARHGLHGTGAQR